MPIARRGLLGLGAVTALSVLTSGCQGSMQPQVERPRRPTRSPHPTTSKTSKAPRPAFFGHPQPGDLYYGASLPYGRSLSAWERFLGSHLALNRSYFTYAPDLTTEVVARCRDDLANNRLPHVSVKPPGTWRAVASGAQDLWLSELLLGLGQERGPIFLTVHHEPENDAGAPGMLPADWVGMQRRALALAADHASNVTVVPVLQHWTFDPVRDDIDPSVWIVPDAPVFGIDVYNPWSLSNGREWRTFGSLTDEVLPWAGNAPIAIGEYGCREDPRNPGLASEWLRDAAEYARNSNVVSMSYFNSGANTTDGSLELHGAIEHTFADLLASSWVARPT